MIERARAAWDGFWYGEVESIRLEALRQGLGYCLLAYMLLRSQYATEWLTAQGFHPSLAADPNNAPHLPLMSPSLLWPAGILFFGSMAAWLFGWLRPVSTWIVWLGLVYVTQVDGISAFTLNRLFIITLLILALAPGPEPPAEGTEPDEGAPQMERAWPLRMIQVLLAVHYLAAGLCKVFHGDWATDTDVLWMQVQGLYMTDAAAWLVRTLPTWSWTAMQHTALGFELMAPLLFAFRRLRPIAFIVGAGFHLIVALTMYQLIYFSAQMLAMYIAFVPPGWLRAVASRLEPSVDEEAPAR